MAKNKVQFDFSALSDIAEKLDKAGADLEKVIQEVLEDAAEEITQDTIDALGHAYLPAGGRYERHFPFCNPYRVLARQPLCGLPAPMV